MESLAQSDLDRLIRLLDDLRQAANEEALALGMLAGLSELIEYDAAGYNDMDLVAGSARWLGAPWEVGEMADRPAFERNMRQHPVLEAFVRTGDGRAVKVWDFLRPRAFRSLELYNDFYRPLGFEHQLIIQWMVGERRLLAVSLFRSAHDFSERDRRLLDLLRPYVVLAQESLQARMRAHAVVAALEQSAGRGGEAVVLAQGEREIELFGQAGRWMSDFFGDRQPGALPEELGRWVAAQRESLLGDEALRPAVGPLVKEGEPGWLDIEFVPRTSRGEPDALLLTLRPRERLPEAGLRELGLTRREGQLLRLVASGRSDAAISAELCIATDTVKKHLQRVYRKLHVHSRTAAVAKVLDGV